jgi:hypothetical protein
MTLQEENGKSASKLLDWRTIVRQAEKSFRHSCPPEATVHQTSEMSDYVGKTGLW